MVHPVTLKQSIWIHHYGCSRRSQELIEYALELWYVLASVLFVAGSVEFMIGTTASERRGCREYDIGAVMFAMGSALYMFENVMHRRIDQAKPRVTGLASGLVRARDRAEASNTSKKKSAWTSGLFWSQLFYCLGSVVFLFGTFIWDPDLFPLFVDSGGSRLSWLQFADALFMIGSFMFSFGAFIAALSVHKVHSMFKVHAVVITSAYEFGGFFFIAGTMAYMPGFHCSSRLETTGATMYLVGSLLYLGGCGLSLFKTIATYQVAREHWQAAETIQTIWRITRNQSHFENALQRIKSTGSFGDESDLGYLFMDQPNSPASTRSPLERSPLDGKRQLSRLSLESTDMNNSHSMQDLETGYFNVRSQASQHPRVSATSIASDSASMVGTGTSAVNERVLRQAHAATLKLQRLVRHRKMQQRLGQEVGGSPQALEGDDILEQRTKSAVLEQQLENDPRLSLRAVLRRALWPWIPEASRPSSWTHNAVATGEEEQSSSAASSDENDDASDRSQTPRSHNVSSASSSARRWREGGL